MIQLALLVSQYTSMVDWLVIFLLGSGEILAMRVALWMSRLLGTILVFCMIPK